MRRFHVRRSVFEDLQLRPKYGADGNNSLNGALAVRDNFRQYCYFDDPKELRAARRNSSSFPDRQFLPQTLKIMRWAGMRQLAGMERALHCMRPLYVCSTAMLC